MHASIQGSGLRWNFEHFLVVGRLTCMELHRGQRVIYTTPLKALSNQKLYEFRKLFGTSRVGLQTGDASLNAEGDVVVMTTEVMRNIMYRGAHDAATGACPCSALLRLALTCIPSQNASVSVLHAVENGSLLHLKELVSSR